MSKWKRFLSIIGIVVIVSVFYLWLFGVQTSSALIVRYSCSKLPDMAKTPVPLSDLSISQKPHQIVSYFGYEFELPWDDVDEQKSKTAGTIHISGFRSGNAFWFSTFPPKDFVNEIMKTSKLDPQSFRQLYGDDAFESDYGFHRKILEATPTEITPFVSRRKAVAGQMLLLIKGVSMPKANSGIFSIRSAGFEGFQFENPQTHPLRITDELYSNDGGICVIFLQKVDGSAPMISQAEINRVIYSIRRTPSEAAASTGTESK